MPTATLQAAGLCQECAEVGARLTHWWCPVLLNALCKSLTCKFSISNFLFSNMAVETPHVRHTVLGQRGQVAAMAADRPPITHRGCSASVSARFWWRWDW